jgi:hypothetical protein
MLFKKLFRNNKIKISSNYLFIVFLFIGFCFFVGISLFYKSFGQKPNYLFVKVKVGQGLWWAATQKPEFWFVKSIKKGEKETDFAGRSQAEIVGVRYYPVLSDTSYSRYDIFLNIKIRTTYDRKNNQYFFKRNAVSVGSPIEFEFSTINITGTVVEMSKDNIKTKYVEKTVYLYNYGAYKKDFPYLYDSIKIGDKYFDGEKEVFRVVDKELVEGIRLSSDNYGRLYEQSTDVFQNILVKAVVKLTEKDGQLFYGEERALKIGDQFPFLTEGYNFEAFSIAKIE